MEVLAIVGSVAIAGFVVWTLICNVYSNDLERKVAALVDGHKKQMEIIDNLHVLIGTIDIELTKHMKGHLLP